MPRTKLDDRLPNPGAVAKLVERYIKIERRVLLDETLSAIGVSKKRYYSRMKDPEDFTFGEFRRFCKELKIPQEELLAACAEALRY